MFTLHIHRLKQDVETLEDVEAIRLTSSQGDCEVLTDHEPFFTTFLPPVLVIKKSGDVVRHIDLEETGFLKVKDNVCDVWIL